MTLYLVVHCISFWDFSPVSEPVELYIDGVRYPYIWKQGGYLAVTNPIPDTFSLCVRSRSFYEVVKSVSKIPDDKVISLQMIPHKFPNGAAQLQLSGFDSEISIVLGFGYYRVTELEGGTVSVKNPSCYNLEGRNFLMRDMKNGPEEFITLGPALDIRLQKYKISAIEGTYSAADVLLLPAVETAARGRQIIPLKIPDNGTWPLWLYMPDCVRYEIMSGQTLTITRDGG